MTNTHTVRAEHLLEIHEEIRLRKSVYPQRVAERLLTPSEAAAKIERLHQVHAILHRLEERNLPPASPFPPGITSLAGLIKEIAREIQWRQKVYTRKVTLRSMEPADRDRKIRLMEEIKSILESMQSFNLPEQSSLF